MKILLITTDIDHIEPYQYVGVKQKGADVTAIVDKNARNLEIFENNDIHYEKLSFNKRRDPKAISFIKKTIGEFKPDIVHVLRKKALSNTIPALKGSDAKLIAYRGIVGNLSFYDPVSRMTFLNHRVDYIVCVAEAIRQHFLSMKGMFRRLSPERVVTIHKGHLIDKYASVPSVDLEQYGVIAGSTVIACVASMRPRKGVDLLVQAFSKLKNDNVSLLLVGEVKDPKIQQAIEASPKQEKIILTGQVSQLEAMGIAGKVDVITMPSTKREGLPRALIEAMAQGTPAVVTNVGGSPELVEDGISGFVVKPNSVESMQKGLEKILQGDLIEQMSREAKLRVSTHFSVDTTIEKNWALYKKALGINDDLPLS